MRKKATTTPSVQYYPEIRVRNRGQRKGTTDEIIIHVKTPEESTNKYNK